MNEERLKILEMLENKTITAKEASELLNTLDSKEVIVDNKVVKEENYLKKDKPKFLKINVVEMNENTKVNVNVPLSFLKAAVSSGKAEKIITGSMKNLDDDIVAGINIEAIIACIDNDFVGDIVNVESDEAKVRIYIE